MHYPYYAKTKYQSIVLVNLFGVVVLDSKLLFSLDNALSPLFSFPSLPESAMKFLVSFVFSPPSLAFTV